MATAIIRASTAMVPEWLATSKAPVSTGTFSMPTISTRKYLANSTRSGGRNTEVVMSSS